jgi:hypothetical protein
LGIKKQKGIWNFVFLQEPAWVRANRVKNATQAQDMCSKQLLRTISDGKMMFGKVKEKERKIEERDL